MRLIDTMTLHLHEFFDSERPAYAILSHTWGQEEVSYQEWTEWEEGSSAQKARIEAKSGFRKIQSACRIARIHRHHYIWVDTNCIDKKSSAELSEAINSMFSWYRTSSTCFVYLEDLPTGSPTKDMSKCRWFTRGWTLQELLAPREVTFLDATWETFGTKSTLCSAIQDATGIDTVTLCNPTYVNRACVAKKMSWASSRQTTRVEDVAYCLLGLFSISMPLLYGEGHDAFRRLQEEIMKVSTDQSLFAWDWPSEIPTNYRQGSHSVTTLAHFPSAFRKCGMVVRDLHDESRHRAFTMTNFGLNIALRLLFGKQGTCYGVLNCRFEKRKDLLICIPLTVPKSTRLFARDNARDVIVIPRRYLPEEPVSISLPRASESPNYVLSLGSLRPKYGGVSCLLFPLSRISDTWEIVTSWPHAQANQRVHVERKDIPHDIRAKSIRVRNRKSNLQGVVIILWAPELEWGHVYSEGCVGREEEDGVGDEILQRAVTEAPPDGDKTATYSELRLEVGFGYSVVNNLGGRWLPLFLSRLLSNVVKPESEIDGDGRLVNEFVDHLYPFQE